MNKPESSEMVLVPREPTHEMMIAVDDAYGDGGDFPDMWEAAIAAAPTRPTAADFEAWLRTVCFQKPTPEAYDLAKCAWRDSRLAAHPSNQVQEPVAPAEKMAPVQGYTPGIPWSLHLEAYDAYRKKWGAQPALIDLEGRNCRGGFGVEELDGFVPGWRDRVSEITKLRAEVAALRAAASQAVPSEQPIAEQPQAEQPDSVYLGSAGPSEDLQTATSKSDRELMARALGLLSLVEQGLRNWGLNPAHMVPTIAALRARLATPGESAGEVQSDKKYLPSSAAPAGQEDARMLTQPEVQALHYSEYGERATAASFRFAEDIQHKCAELWGLKLAAMSATTNPTK